jgi:hypothetical protein
MYLILTMDHESGRYSIASESPEPVDLETAKRIALDVARTRQPEIVAAADVAGHLERLNEVHAMICRRPTASARKWRREHWPDFPSGGPR